MLAMPRSPPIRHAAQPHAIIAAAHFFSMLDISMLAFELFIILVSHFLGGVLHAAQKVHNICFIGSAAMPRD